VISPEVYEAVRFAARLQFTPAPTTQPDNMTTFAITGADINALCIAWRQANPLMRACPRLLHAVADDEPVIVELFGA
jgi:hypothetical protein